MCLLAKVKLGSEPYAERYRGGAKRDSSADGAVRKHGADMECSQETTFVVICKGETAQAVPEFLFAASLIQHPGTFGLFAF